jgi:hypothetical protein
MAEDPPPNPYSKNEKTKRLPASPTIPFPPVEGQRAPPIPQDTPGLRPIRQSLDAIKRSDYRVPQPQKEGALGIIVAVIAVLAILIGFGAAYWWLRH